MDQRLQLVREYRSGLFTMTELAQQYAISRKTGYKWVDRYAADDSVMALADRSRRPHVSPHATPADVLAALLAVRKRHPRWGARKLLVVAAQHHPTFTWPSRSTVCDLLTRAGLIAPRSRRLAAAVGHAPSLLAPITTANGTWTTDFKGEFRTGDRQYCYPFTLRDGFSRYVLRCQGLRARTLANTRRCFLRAFEEYGLPERIRSDNGSPFAGIGLGRLSRLALWWMRLGIVPERITPGHPEQNGSHEQFHSVLKADTARPAAANLRAQQRRFDRFCTEYNHVRPHEALADHVPARHYTVSPRPMPAALPPLIYPGHMEVRRVSTTGSISWREPVFLSETLAGEPLGFEEVSDGLWTIYYGTIVLARFNERLKRVQPILPLGTDRSPPTPSTGFPIPTKLSPMSPD